jgi:hypothetical protein
MNVVYGVKDVAIKLLKEGFDLEIELSDFLDADDSIKVGKYSIQISVYGGLYVDEWDEKEKTLIHHIQDVGIEEVIMYLKKEVK